MSAINTSSSSPSFITSLLIKRMLLGSGIALLLILLFLAGVKDPDPSWPRLWWMRPLLIVPIAGAMGSACFYYLHDHRPLQGTKKYGAVILGLILYLVALWMGAVAGLDGTLWD